MQICCQVTKCGLICTMLQGFSIDHSGHQHCLFNPSTVVPFKKLHQAEIKSRRKTANSVVNITCCFSFHLKFLVQISVYRWAKFWIRSTFHQIEFLSRCVEHALSFPVSSSYFNIIAGWLESANWSILAARRLFKDFGGEKNQDFMIIRCPISWFVYQWRHFTTS